MQNDVEYANDMLMNALNLIEYLICKMKWTI